PVVLPRHAARVHQVRDGAEPEARVDVRQLAAEVDHRDRRLQAVVAAPRAARVAALRDAVDGPPAEQRAVAPGLRGDREDVVAEARAAPRREHAVTDAVRARVRPVARDLPGLHLGVGDVLVALPDDGAALVAEAVHGPVVVAGRPGG